MLLEIMVGDSHKKFHNNNQSITSLPSNGQTTDLVKASLSYISPRIIGVIMQQDYLKTKLEFIKS